MSEMLSREECIKLADEHDAEEQTANSVRWNYEYRMFRTIEALAERIRLGSQLSLHPENTEAFWEI